MRWASARMRALVAAEISGASRMTFETVMTETPAWAAISFKRTLVPRPCILQTGPAPIEFIAQRFEKGTAAQAHEADGFGGATNSHHIASGQRQLHLAVGTEKNFEAFGKIFYFDDRLHIHNDGTIRKCVRTNRRDGEGLGVWTHDSAAGG